MAAMYTNPCTNSCQRPLASANGESWSLPRRRGSAKKPPKNKLPKTRWTCKRRVVFSGVGGKSSAGHTCSSSDLAIETRLHCYRDPALGCRLVLNEGVEWSSRRRPRRRPFRLLDRANELGDQRRNLPPSLQNFAGMDASGRCWDYLPGSTLGRIEPSLVERRNAERRLPVFPSSQRSQERDPGSRSG